MKLPENPTKKVRDILAIQIQCPGARLTDEELYKIKELCNCLDTTIATMKLHAGDCCSLNNEVGLFRGHWEDAEKRCGELEEEVEVQKQQVILSESQNYCKICGNTLDGYKPKKE